jgi:hypothetical protein
MVVIEHSVPFCVVRVSFLNGTLHLQSVVFVLVKKVHTSTEMEHLHVQILKVPEATTTRLRILHSARSRWGLAFRKELQRALARILRNKHTGFRRRFGLFFADHLFRDEETH